MVLIVGLPRHPIKSLVQTFWRYRYSSSEQVRRCHLRYFCIRNNCRRICWTGNCLIGCCYRQRFSVLNVASPGTVANPSTSRDSLPVLSYSVPESENAGTAAVFAYENKQGPSRIFSQGYYSAPTATAGLFDNFWICSKS